MGEIHKRGLRRARNPMPPCVRDALNERGLMEAYRERPPYQQNDYLGWIARAKLEATRFSRLNQMLDELRGGKMYMTWPGGHATFARVHRDSVISQRRAALAE